MIESKNVHLSYGKRVIARDISFSASAGEITVLLGKNGSGKTTLLRALSGGAPYGGSITIWGQEIKALSPLRRARLVGLMPQMFPAPDITVRRLVAYGRQPYAGLSGILAPADHEKIDAVLRETGLESLAEATLPRVSGGERQKSYFAMLLAQDCPCLLLDEPGAHLDAENMNELCALLKAAKERGKAVIAVLHDINRALSLADRLLVLDGGRLIFNGPPDALAASDIPARVFGLTRCHCLTEGQTASQIIFL